MSKALSVPAPPLATTDRTEARLPALPLQLAGGWVVAGLLNLLADFLPGHVHPLDGPQALAHAVDFGRHLAFGLCTLASVWVLRRWLPPLFAWLALAVFSLSLGAFVLPTDLDGLAERLSDRAGVSAELASAAVVVLIGGAVPLLAWLSQPRSWRWRWLGHAIQMGCAVAALCAAYVNASISPGGNPSAHLYLSWLTAIFAGHALPRLELPAEQLRARRWPLAVAAALVLGSLWALFWLHPNSVMIRLARRPSSLHLVAVLHGDGGVGNVHAALVARAGPFFSARAQLPSIPPSAQRPPVQRPVVVLFSIDSLRADLPRQEKYAEFLPNLREMMSGAADFTHARAPGSMTKYTLGSISMGKYFSQQFWSGGKNRWPKQDTSVHFASVLTAAGVLTAAFPVTEWLMDGSGILRGFERNEIKGQTLPGHDRWIDGSALTAQLIETLEGAKDRPAFLWVHYLDSHDPYYKSGLKGGSTFKHYLRSLRVVDGYLGQVRAAVARLGLTERTLLLAVADHGEAFGEHDSRFHGSNLYDELIRVPLVAAGPGVVPRVIDAPVSLIDLGPTILDWFGLSTPASFMGQSLVPLLLGGSRSFQRPIVAETRLKQAMVFEDGYKAIRDLRRKTLELYDLKKDPGELANLSDQVDVEHEEHLLLLRSFFEVHTYREGGYRVPYVK